MKLNIIEKLILLSLDDEKGNLLSSGAQFNTAIIGATIAELILLGKLRISEERIKVSNTTSTNDKVLDYALAEIRKSKKDKKLSHWILTLASKAPKTIEIYEQKFIDNKILYRKDSKVLWFFDKTNFPAKDSTLENIFRRELNDIVFKNNTADINNKILIGLIKASDLNKEIYGKKLSKETKKAIKDIYKSNELSLIIHDKVEEAYISMVAVMVAVM
ncbi:MAG: hypothetical protein B6I18_06575 [Bacteroidetes bacterium 4572_112]|nr:MAG: hypothetical protein B6I18_06575 [Bacteroidetes bacterium 4572_112]